VIDKIFGHQFIDDVEIPAFLCFFDQPSNPSPHSLQRSFS
jgi:hypothetical protein